MAQNKIIKQRTIEVSIVCDEFNVADVLRDFANYIEEKGQHYDKKRIYFSKQRNIGNMKKTPNQIREELRRQIAKQHNDEIENLKKTKSQYWQKYLDADKKCCELQNENGELKDKVAQLEDWNRRLMEFMDMSEEERKAAIEEMKESARINGLLDTFCGGYAKMLGTFFL